jgi:hypothetical protein
LENVVFQIWPIAKIVLFHARDHHDVADIVVPYQPPKVFNCVFQRALRNDVFFVVVEHLEPSFGEENLEPTTYTDVASVEVLRMSKEISF